MLQKWHQIQVTPVEPKLRPVEPSYDLSEQQKYEREHHTIHQRDEETSGELMKWFHRLAGFVGKKAGPLKEQAKYFKWALCDWILDGIVNTKFTDVAHVANAARNMEILHERSSQNNKRNRDGDRIRSTTQDSNKRGYDQKGYAGWKRILKKRTKTRQKTTKPNTKWKRSKKTKSIEAESQKSKPVVNKSQL
uniref:Zinc finger, CCHC-type, retrotransposon Gag domain protein n=1 Tax=Tanacetum cinerariifolium TaxID=118510 RepID=A0A6L2NKW7_TANCI|nr:zinc finger, CCHC-type, retrotransposon Gag domain protein [Tanacetum cinerariifolium]